MFGPRLTTVFRSRWRALWFVASVLLGVWWMVPAGDDAVPAPEPSAHHRSPWARD